MQKLKCVLTTLALLMCLSATAMAGDTQGPSNPAPGETNSPPGETQSPPGETQTPPGDGHSPGVMAAILEYLLGID